MIEKSKKNIIIVIMAMSMVVLLSCNNESNISPKDSSSENQEDITNDIPNGTQEDDNKSIATSIKKLVTCAEMLVDYNDEAKALQVEHTGLFNADGYAPCVQDGKLIIVKYTGEIIQATSIECTTAEWVRGSTNLIVIGFPSVQDNTTMVYSIVDKEGNRKIERQSNNLDVGILNDGMVRVSSGEDTFAQSTSAIMWLDELGQVVIPEENFRSGTDFISGIAYAEEGDFIIANDYESNAPTWRGFIDKSGNRVITLDDDMSYGDSAGNQYALNNGRIILSSGDYKYVVDTKGNVIIPNGKYFYIDGVLSGYENKITMGDYINQPVNSQLYFRVISREQQANGDIGEKEALLDKDGNEVATSQYDALIYGDATDGLQEKYSSSYYSVERINGDVLLVNTTESDRAGSDYYLTDASGEAIKQLGNVWGSNDRIPGVFIYHLYNGGDYICDYKGNLLISPTLDEDTCLEAYSPYLWTKGMMAYGIIQIKVEEKYEEIGDIAGGEQAVNEGKATEKYEDMSDAKVGGIIHFGNYDWHILDIKDSKALLITKDIVLCRSYDDSGKEYDEGVTWEESTLREYLNNEFYQEFSEEERVRILETNNSYYTDLGDDTSIARDYIFILDMIEAEKYFKDDIDRVGKFNVLEKDIKEEAEKRYNADREWGSERTYNDHYEIIKKDIGKAAAWELRSFCSWGDQRHMSGVGNNGHVYQDLAEDLAYDIEGLPLAGSGKNITPRGQRPVMWVSTNKIVEIGDVAE